MGGDNVDTRRRERKEATESEGVIEWEKEKLREEEYNEQGWEYNQHP